MCHLNPCIAATLILVVMAGIAPWATAQPKDSPASREKELTLKKALLEAARKAYESEVQLRNTGMGGSTESVARWSRRWLDAQCAVSNAKADQVSAYRGHLLRMQDLERRTALLVKSGNARAAEAGAVTYFRIEAELWLEQVGAR